MRTDRIRAVGLEDNDGADTGLLGADHGIEVTQRNLSPPDRHHFTLPACLREQIPAIYRRTLTTSRCRPA